MTENSSGLRNVLKFFVKAKKMTSALALAHYDPNLLIVLARDASDYGIGAIISRSESSIAYASHSLSRPERNYTQVEKEALTLICDWIYENLP